MARLVLIQTEQNRNPKVNIERALDAVKRACELCANDEKKADSEMCGKAERKAGPDMVIFPERFMAPYPSKIAQELQISKYHSLDGEFVTSMCKLAQEYKTWLVFGICEIVEDDDKKYYNTVVLVDDSGEIQRVYRKTHLYDAFGSKESDIVKAGDKLFDPIDTPFGRIGLMVCYELRFPEVARDQALKGADILIMPTAWEKGENKSLHFRTLNTARALENTFFMVACDQCGKYCIGESVVIDPVGNIVAEAGSDEEILMVDIDLEKISRAREKMPVLENRREELYKNII